MVLPSPLPPAFGRHEVLEELGTGAETAEAVVLEDGLAKGLLLVEIEPPGVVVELDGARVDVPLSGLPLSFGSHSVRLSREGCEEATMPVEVAGAHPVVRLSATLSPRADGGTAPGLRPLAKGVVPPRRITGARPKAPPEARRQGAAIADVDVRETGEILQVLKVQGNPRLFEALLEAVRGWHFAPATRNGTPLAVRPRVHHLFLP